MDNNSIIKAVLILENGIIPRNSNFETVNPKIPVDKWNIRFPNQSVPWPTPGLRRISVNSFGVGGTNAHTILDDAYTYITTRGIEALHNTRKIVPSAEDLEFAEATREEQCAENDKRIGNGDAAGTILEPPLIFPITSFDEDGVRRNATALAAYLKSTSKTTGHLESSYLYDLAYTLTSKRSIFPWKSYIIANGSSELVQKLSGEKGFPAAVRARTGPKIGFVFTGQGAQWHAMGRELMVYPIFADSIQAAATYITSLGAKWNLVEELQKSKENSRVNEPFLAHPSCVALQVALVELLASWRVLPGRVVGHSSGEIVAAFAAGKLSREAAWKAGYFRGYVSAKEIGKDGTMIAVGLSAVDAEEYMKPIHDELPGEVKTAGDCHILKASLTSHRWLFHASTVLKTIPYLGIGRS